jgi:hypothetical protein
MPQSKLSSSNRGSKALIKRLSDKHVIRTLQSLGIVGSEINKVCEAVKKLDIDQRKLIDYCEQEEWRDEVLDIQKQTGDKLAKWLTHDLSTINAPIVTQPSHTQQMLTDSSKKKRRKAPGSTSKKKRDTKKMIGIIGSLL